MQLLLSNSYKDCNSVISLRSTILLRAITVIKGLQEKEIILPVGTSNYEIK